MKNDLNFNLKNSLKREICNIFSSRKSRKSMGGFHWRQKNENGKLQEIFPGLVAQKGLQTDFGCGLWNGVGNRRFKLTLILLSSKFDLAVIDMQVARLNIFLIVAKKIFRIDSIMLVEEGFEVVSSDASDKMLKYALKERWNRRKEKNFDNWSKLKIKKISNSSI